MRSLLLLALGVLTAAPAVSAADRSQVVVLVRHAEKSDAPPGDVVLSASGQARAEELAVALAEARIDTIVTTQFRRTRDTAAPLAAQMRVKPIVVAAGTDTASHVKAVAAAVRSGGASVLVVGHSNTIPAIIAALGGPRMDELCDAEYSNLFTLALMPGQPARLIHGHFGAPDELGEGDCGKKMKQ